MSGFNNIRSNYLTDTDYLNLLENMEMCDVCGRSGTNLLRKTFPYKQNIHIVIRHHYWCDPQLRMELFNSATNRK